MKKRKISIDKILLITIILFIYFEPPMFKIRDVSVFIKFDNIYKILKLIGALIIFIMYGKKKKFSKLFISMFVFQGFAFLSTIINHGSISRFAGPALTTLVMIMAAELLIHKQKLFDVMKNCIIYFRICFVLNIISIFIVDFIIKKPINVYFLGIDNRFIFVYLPWITFEFLYSLKKYNKISKTSFLMFLLSEATLLYKYSLSAMVVSILWVFVLFIGKRTVKHSKSIYFSTVLMNILIVVVKIQNKFGVILSKLKKGITLSGRTYLWDAIFADLKKHPLLGNGMQSVEVEQSFFYNFSHMEYFKNNFAPHAHNNYMTVLLRGGILGLMIYIYIFWICFKQLADNFKNKYSKVLLLSIIISLILGIFDTFDWSGLYFVMACCFGVNLIDQNKNEEKEDITKKVYFCETPYQVIVSLYLKNQQKDSNVQEDIVIANTFNGAQKVVQKLKEKNIFNEVYLSDIKDLINCKRKIHYLKKLFYVLFPEKMIKKLWTTNIKYYDEMYFGNYDSFTASVRSYYAFRNRFPKIYLYEEAYISYFPINEMYPIKNYLKIIESRNKILGLSKANRNNINGWFLFEPNNLLYDPCCPVYKIDRTIGTKTEFKNLIDDIFEARKCVKKYDKKFIIFEEALIANGSNVDDEKVFDKIIDIVGKENVIIKLHPRIREDRFSKKGIKTLGSDGIPWEAITSVGDFSDKVFISISSSCVINYKMLVGNKMKGYLLFKFLKPNLKQFDEKYDAFWKKVGANDSGINIPKTEKEFYDRISIEVSDKNEKKNNNRKTIHKRGK